MDLFHIAQRLGLSESNQLIRKASPALRCTGQICKAIMCLEIAASRFNIIFDRQTAIKMSGMSEKSYTRSLICYKTALVSSGSKLDIRELGIQFGCVRLIPFVEKGLSLYKERFLALSPASRRESADFNRPVFTAVAFYLFARKQKLKVDKLKLIEVCGTSEFEFNSVATAMNNPCHDVFVVTKEKKDPREIKGSREFLDALPGKRKIEDGGYLSDDGAEVSSYKRQKRRDKVAYEEWKSCVLSPNENQAKAPCKRTTQTSLDFKKKVAESQELEAM